MFRYDLKAGLYYLANRKYVNLADVKAGAEAAVQRARADLQTLAEKRAQNKITRAEWYRGMQDAIKRLHFSNAALARGGWLQMTRADYIHVERIIYDELVLLRRFAKQVIDGEIKETSARFAARCVQYAGRARGTYENSRIEDNERKRGHNQFRRILAESKHCKPSARPSCTQAAAMGWVRKPQFIPINGCTCDGGCHCVAQSRFFPEN